MAKYDHNKRPAVNDWHLWSEVTRSVSPLRPVSPPDSAPTPDAVGASPARKSKKIQAQVPSWSPASTPIRHSNNDAIAPSKDIEPRMRRRLARGRLPIDATIDLHGLRQSEAHAALCRFVAARYQRGDRTILVITGKGLKKVGYGAIEQRGVLRTMLPIWLREPALSPMIAGWEVSAQTHGGEGAFYVRLKKAGL